MQANDEKKVLDARKKNQNEEVQLIEDLKMILQTPQGFRFFKWFFTEGNLTAVSMTGNSWTFFKEGHRNFAKHVHNLVVDADCDVASKILHEILLEQRGKE
jgi:hypothetical protein